MTCGSSWTLEENTAKHMTLNDFYIFQVFYIFTWLDSKQYFHVSPPEQVILVCPLLPRHLFSRLCPHSQEWSLKNKNKCSFIYSKTKKIWEGNLKAMWSQNRDKNQRICLFAFLTCIFHLPVILFILILCTRFSCHFTFTYKAKFEFVVDLSSFFHHRRAGFVPPNLQKEEVVAQETYILQVRPNECNKIKWHIKYHTFSHNTG